MKRGRKCIYPPQSRTYAPETYNTNARGSDASRGSNIVYGPEHETDTQGRASLNLWSAQCQGLRRRQHRTEHKGHTPNPRIGNKIPDTAGNRTRAAGLEGRDYQPRHGDGFNYFQFYFIKSKLVTLL